MPIYAVVLIVLGILLFLFIIIWISCSNALERSLIKIEEAESGIDVALTKRYDVLTKEVDIVKSVVKHETETFEKVIKLRQGMSMEEKQEACRQMDDLTKKLNITLENYPELKSSENFKALQLSVADVEEHLQAARRAYNANISSYNQKLRVFPTNIIAKGKKLEKKPFFEAEEMKRQDVDVKIGL